MWDWVRIGPLAIVFFNSRNDPRHEFCYRATTNILYYINYALCFCTVFPIVRQSWQRVLLPAWTSGMRRKSFAILCLESAEHAGSASALCHLSNVGER